MASTAMLLSKAKHIYLWPWTSNTAPGAVKINPDETDAKRLELLSVVSDSVAITQDDPETSSIECETRDEPIVETVTAGKYTVTMDSADISFDILETALGFTKVGTVAAAAPASYAKKYASVAVVFDTHTLVLPKILLTSKIDASSLKTGIAKGTLSGTGYSAKVTIDANPAVDTPFFAVTNNSSVTIAELTSTGE